MPPRGPGGSPTPPPVHTHTFHGILRSIAAEWGPWIRGLPQAAGMAPMGSMKGKRQEPLTVVNLRHKDPRCHPTGKIGHTSLCPRPLTALCTPWSPDPSPDFVLPQDLVSFDAQCLARCCCLGSRWNPSLGLENYSGTGASPGGLGREQGKVGRWSSEQSDYQGGSHRSLGHRRRDEGRITPGWQPAFVWADRACPSLPFFSPQQSPAEVSIPCGPLLPAWPFSGN